MLSGEAFGGVDPMGGGDPLPSFARAPKLVDERGIDVTDAKEARKQGLLYKKSTDYR